MSKSPVSGIASKPTTRLKISGKIRFSRTRSSIAPKTSSPVSGPPKQQKGNPVPDQTAALGRVFWEEWLTHRRYLFCLALRWSSNNHANAEDALSRLAIKAHNRYLIDHAQIRNIRPWMSRLLHNMCMDEHRKNSVRNRAFDKLTPDQYAAAALTPSLSQLQEERSALKQPVTEAMNSIMAMPVRLRYPFVLRFIYQYSNSEIARQLGLTEVNVRKRIQLGRQLVRQDVNDRDLQQ